MIWMGVGKNSYIYDNISHDIIISYNISWLIIDTHTLGDSW